MPGAVMLSKKHYIFTAAILRQARGAATKQEAITQIAAALADMFADDNPAFDKARFVVATLKVKDWEG